MNYLRYSQANSQPFGDREAEENATDEGKGRKGYKKTEFGQDAAISMKEEAIFVQSYKSRARDLEHTLDACSASCASLVAIRPFACEKKRFSCQNKSARIS